MTKLITPGELAPDFELAEIDGNRIRLSDYRGRPVVIAFLRGFM
jgi:peroxiredoxin